MSVQDLVDRRLVEWETRLQAKVLRNRDAIVQKNGREKYEAMLARAQELDEMASAAYREWTGLADQAPVENPSDQAAYVRGLNEAKKRALANVREPGVVRDVQERIDGELRDLVDAAVAFKGLKDQFGLLYGSPEDAIQEFMHRPEQMQGALSFVMGGFSDFRRFWDEIRPDVERLRKMNPEDDGAVEQAVAGSQLASAMGMLLSDTTSRMTVGAATGGDSREFVKSRFLKGLDEKDRAAVEANPEPFVDYAQARALYVQGAASAEQMASQAAKEGGTYRDALKQHGARLQALHEKLVEMREALPPLERDAALWLPPDAKGFQEDPGGVSQFFRGMARKALETINPFADPGKLALVAPRMEAPKHKAGFIPWNAQAWGEAVADLGISLPGFGAGGAAAGAVRLAKPIAQRAAQGAVAGGVGMLAQPGAVKEAAEGDVGALAGRGLGGAVAGAGLGAAGGAVERAAFNWRAGKALGEAVRKAPEPDASGQAIASLRPTRPTASVGESATRAGLTEAAESSAPIPMRVRPARPAPTPKVRFERKSPGVFRSEDGRFTVRRLGNKEWVVEDRGLYEVGGKRHAVVSDPVSSSLEAMKIARNRVAGRPVGTGTKGGGPGEPMVPGKEPTKAPRPKKPAPYQQPDAELPEFGTVPFARGPQAEPPWSGLSLAEPSRGAAKAATPKAVQGAAPVAAEAPALTTGQKARITRSSNLAKRNTPPTVRNMTLADRIIEEARRVEPFRKEQRKLFAQDRRRRSELIEKIGTEDPTEVGFIKQLEALKGEMPRPDFGKPKLTPAEYRQAIVTISRSEGLAPFEKLNAKQGFRAFTEGYLPEPAKRDLLERVFGPEVVTAMEEKVFGIPNLGNRFSDILGLTRGMKSMLDYTSMALRQGAHFGSRYPGDWSRALFRSWKNAFSPKNNEDFKKIIVSDPDYRLAVQAGVNLPSIASKRFARVAGREETFQNDLGEKLPWLLGSAYRSSQRAAETFLTQQRLAAFKATKGMIDVENPDALAALGDYINTFTGRASLGKYAQAGELLAKVGFAPKFAVSRLQAFNPFYYWKMPKEVRMHALETGIRFHGARLALLGLASQVPGVEVGWDPKSADFGKIKIGGKVRVDMYAGYQQIARTIHQLLFGVTKSTVTGKVRRAGTKEGKGIRWKTLTQFFQSRQHPVVGFIHDQFAEEDFVGKPVDTSAKGTAIRALRMYEPLFLEDMYDLLQEKPELFPILFPASQLGIGVQTYPLSKEKK